EPDRLPLDWAARLSEIGLSVAHAQYHKHSAYILTNADMPGFSRMEQQRLARIVLAHRGKLAKMHDAGLEDADWALVFALRVAGDDVGYALDLPQAWLEENPLAAAALETETEHWKAIGMKFSVNSLSEKKVAQLRG